MTATTNDLMHENKESSKAKSSTITQRTSGKTDILMTNVSRETNLKG